MPSAPRRRNRSARLSAVSSPSAPYASVRRSSGPYAGNAGSFIPLNRPHHALDVAIAIIGIHKTGEFGGFDNFADSGQHLGEAGEAKSGNAYRAAKSAERPILKVVDPARSISRGDRAS